MEEDIKILEEYLKHIEKDPEKILKSDEIIKFIEWREIQAIKKLLNRFEQYEQKLMFALSPTNHELALETQRNFKKIIMQNIDKDTYTIRKELKKYWDNMNTYWEG